MTYNGHYLYTLQKIMKRLTILFLAIPIILTWCWTTKTQKAEFEWFSINIDQDFKKTDWSLVENKQIINKVLLAYKKTNKQKDWFDENVMIAKTTINSGLTWENFAKINIEKIQENIQWTQSIKSASIKFKCKEKNIEWIYNIISIPQDGEDINDKNRKSYYINQYYFVNWAEGYIISFSTDVQKNAENFVNNLKKITCN